MQIIGLILFYLAYSDQFTILKDIDAESPIIIFRNKL